MSSFKDRASLCSECSKPLDQRQIQPRVDFSKFYNEMRSNSELHILNTKEVDDSLSLCDKDLGDLEEVIARYEGEIAHMQSQLLHFQEQKKRLEDYRKQLQSFTSAIRKFPNETLGLIFDYVCEWNEFPYQHNVRRPLIRLIGMPALSLASTCSRWRSIAVALPSLWSRLKIIIGPADAAGRAYDAYIASINLFLSRSKIHPLMIDLDFNGLRPDQSPPSLSLVLEHIQRFKYLKCNCADLALIFDGTRNFPNLETLNIWKGAYGQIQQNFGLRVPKLTALRKKFIGDSPRPHLNNLTSIELMGGVDAMNEVFPTVTTLKIWSMEYNDVNPPLLSHTIKNLVVIFSSEQFIVFPSFTFPALDRLHLLKAQCLDHWKWSGDAFAAFISRSSCRITTLILESVGLSDTELVAALQLLPELVTLEITNQKTLSEVNPFTSNFIHALHGSGTNTLDGSRMVIVPRLRYLTWDFDSIDFDDEAFIGMISSRWLPRVHSLITLEGVTVDCLRSVVLKFYEREVVEEVYRPLAKMDEKGLRVAVIGTNGTKI